MQPLLTFNVTPNLPGNLEPLRELALNLHWTWNPLTRKLFRNLDPDLWDETYHNPVRMLQLVRQSRLEELAADEAFLSELRTVHAATRGYMDREDTYGKARRKSSPLQGSIAYFSAEFGFHESFPNYSGGLGILSGDHCKSASDLDLDFVAVSLLYRHGYFKQHIDAHGWQHAIELDQNFDQLPIKEVVNGDGPVLIPVKILDRTVAAKVWEMAVGRIKLYLMDTDIAENTPEDRLITAHLYGGDHEMRIRQEIVLGIGGVHALHAVGIHPQVYHMNEGHSAFLAIERIARSMERNKIDFSSAHQIVAASNVFTTHTPVPAGNDAFPADLIRRYLGHYPERLGISFDTFYSFGQASQNPSHEFSMTILALRTSRHSNGVSKLHGEVSQGLWKDVWINIPVAEVPIGHVTNGIHTKTWLAPEYGRLFDRHLGPDWDEHLTEPDFWRRISEVPTNEIWEVHQRLKARLVEFVRERLRRQRERNGESPEKIRNVDTVLHPDVLTIGFARRFATYKRATLLFTDAERLHTLLNHPDHPVQFVFAGKSHPQDEGGKRLIQEVYNYSRKEGFSHRFVFVEDYDHRVGRRLYQGVDVWLNNPVRPEEASGTSGMKAPPNGGLNLSVLDGWWCEGYNGENGWAIGHEITEGSLELQNEVDSASIYQLIENQIAPLFYSRPDGRLPHGWISRMRNSISSILPRFNTHRMVREYNEKFYEPAAEAKSRLFADKCAKARELSAWKENIRKDWHKVEIQKAEVDAANRFSVPVGNEIKVKAQVKLGSINPEDVLVQAYYGPYEDGEIKEPRTKNLSRVDGSQKSGFVYEGILQSDESGAYGLNVRVIPASLNLTQPHETRLITWARRR